MYGYGQEGFASRSPEYKSQWTLNQERPREIGGHRGKGPVGYTRTDEKIREQVCELLTDDDHIDATHIEVIVKHGEVILTGTVDDRRTKRMAEEVAEHVAGVKDVQNQLRVRGNPSPESAVGTQETATSDKKHRA
jgi:osmotically-inducible protein OsmY